MDSIFTSMESSIIDALIDRHQEIISKSDHAWVVKLNNKSSSTSVDEEKLEDFEDFCDNLVMLLRAPNYLELLNYLASDVSYDSQLEENISQLTDNDYQLTDDEYMLAYQVANQWIPSSIYLSY